MSCIDRFSVEDNFGVPFAGFQDTCWGCAYERAFMQIKREIDRANLGVDSENQWTVAHDRSAAIARISADYAARVICAANRSLGSHFRVKFSEIRDEQDIIVNLIGCTGRQVFDFATGRVADLIGGEGARLLAANYEDGSPLEWLLLSAHVTNLGLLPTAEMENEVSIYDQIFNDMERLNLFYDAVQAETKIMRPAVEKRYPDRVRDLWALRSSQTVYPAMRTEASVSEDEK
jgi:hypothetical protein